MSVSVADRVAVTVVVEVDVDVPTHCSPFPDPVRPPAQVCLGVGPAIQVMRIRAVHPYIHEGCRGPQHTGQPGATRHAIRGPVPGQQIEDVVVHPTGMPEFHGDRNPRRQHTQKVVQPGVVPTLLRGELRQQYRPLIPQLVPPGRDPRHPPLRRIQLLAVGQPTGSLHRHSKPWW